MKTLVLLHGALGSDANLNQIAETLKQNFKVYTFCFSGHGNVPFENDFNIEQFSLELKQFLQRNQLDKPAVFGFSMGGYVALKLQASEKVFSKIITLGTKFDWNIESSVKEASMLNPNVLSEKVPAYVEYLKTLHGDSWEKLVQRTAQMMLEMGQNPPLAKTDLYKITCPVLCGRGENDKMVSAEETIAVIRNLSAGKYEEIPGWIHPIERLDQKLLADWILMSM